MKQIIERPIHAFKNGQIVITYLDRYFQNAIRSFDGETKQGLLKEDETACNEAIGVIKTIFAEKVPNVLKRKNEMMLKWTDEEVSTVINALEKITSLPKSKHAFEALQALYEQITGIPQFNSIKNGDELRNINCYEYLKNFLVAEPGVNDAGEDFWAIDENQVIKEVFSVIKNKYNPNYPYGNLYTDFLLRLEELIKIDHPIVIDLIDSVYINPNLALERAYHVVEPVLKNQNQTSSQCEKAVRDFLEIKNKKSINALNPRDMDTVPAKIDKVYARNLRPQVNSSQPSLRQYAYQTKEDPIEIRMGTQGVFTDFNPEIYAVWTAWRKHQARLNPSKKVEHVYFNMLPEDRAKPTDSVKHFFSPNVHNTHIEVQVTKQLHEAKEIEQNEAHITLPSARGLLDPKLSKTLSYEDTLNKIFQIASGTSEEKIKDCRISEPVKALLYGSFGGSYDNFIEKSTLENLLHETFNAFGFKPGDSLSPKDQQMLAFHFFKYQLPHFIINKLKPKSFNMSCWDGIDRAGVASAYYNLINSIQRNTPLSQVEFEKALHAAPVIVKERSLNNQIKLLWSVVDYYVTKKEEHYSINVPQWLKDWRDQNNPHTKHVINKASSYTSNEILFIIASMGMYAYLRNCVDYREENLTSPTAILKIGVAVVLPPVAMLIGLFSFIHSLCLAATEENLTSKKTPSTNGGLSI